MSQSDPTVPTLKNAMKQFKQLLLLIRPYWVSFLKVTILGPAISLLEMVAPFLTKLLIDEVYPSRSIELMHVLVASILTLNISSALMKGIRDYYSMYISTKLNNVVNLLFFNHLQHLSARFFENHQVGEISSRFQDVNSALGTITHVFSTVFLQGFYLIIVPPFLILLHWKLALVGLISVPITVVITALAGRLMRKYWKESAEAYADYSAFQVEMLSQIRSLKTMAMEHFVYNKSKEKVDNAIQKNLRSEGISQLISIINTVLYALNTALFTWLGWTLIIEQEMSLGDYIAFTMYVGYLYSPFSQFVNLFSSFQHSAINLNRMFEYLNTKPEQEPKLVYKKPAEIKHILKGGFEFRDVSFGYSDEKQVLSGLNFEIKPGSIFSIIGESGSGKTTILKLMTSIEKPGSGNIYIDKIPLSEISIKDLRRQMGVVWQDFSLFKGSILENLTFGQNGIANEVIEEAIEICRLESLINDLPNSYNTHVAEWGATLSGGQRQRIAIARALIRNAPVMVMDEPTSNIDVQTEKRIFKELFKYCRKNNKTVVLVTHRIASATMADQICFIDSGKVQHIGNHKELLKSSMRYNRMFETFIEENGDNL